MNKILQIIKKVAALCTLTCLDGSINHINYMERYIKNKRTMRRNDLNFSIEKFLFGVW